MGDVLALADDGYCIAPSAEAQLHHVTVDDPRRYGTCCQRPREEADVSVGRGIDLENDVRDAVGSVD